jgi:ribose-phosphate pyrophosphokinase
MNAYIDLTIGSEEMMPFGDLPRIRINKHYFSAGECHMSLRDLNDLKGIEKVTILCHGTSHNIMELLQIKDILKRNGISNVLLYMPYFYYSRQDRATTPESSFSLEIFCKILWEAGFDFIITHDAHSEVVEELLPGMVINLKPVKFLKHVWSEYTNYDYIIAPDKGAQEKIFDLWSCTGLSRDKVLTATKVRDPETGQLGSPSMSPLDLAALAGRKALIFDDICDGGYTFIQLAKFIQDQVETELDLAVTHGIFSKGTDKLKKIFGTIYTTDSMPATYGTERIKHVL